MLHAIKTGNKKQGPCFGGVLAQRPQRKRAVGATEVGLGSLGWVLGGSWVVISGVTSTVTIVITHLRGLMTPRITTHEPPSRVLGFGYLRDRQLKVLVLRIGLPMRVQSIGCDRVV